LQIFSCRKISILIAPRGIRYRWPASAKLLTKDESRRIAANIAKLPKHGLDLELRTAYLVTRSDIYAAPRMSVVKAPTM
jgi:hypothetical protein